MKPAAHTFPPPPPTRLPHTHTSQADGLPSDFIGSCNVSECRSATLAAQNHLVPAPVVSKARDPLTWVPLLAAIPLLLAASLTIATASYILLHAPMFSAMHGASSKSQRSDGSQAAHAVGVATHGDTPRGVPAPAAGAGQATGVRRAGPVGEGRQGTRVLPGSVWTQAGPVAEAQEGKGISLEQGGSGDVSPAAAGLTFEFHDVTLSIPVSATVAQQAISHAARLALEANAAAAAEAGAGAGAKGGAGAWVQPATAATFCAIVAAPSRDDTIQAGLSKALSGVGLVSPEGLDGRGLGQQQQQRQQQRHAGGRFSGFGLKRGSGSGSAVGSDLESAQTGSAGSVGGSGYRMLLLQGVTGRARAGEVLGLLVSDTLCAGHGSLYENGQWAGTYFLLALLGPTVVTDI